MGASYEKKYILKIYYFRFSEGFFEDSLKDKLHGNFIDWYALLLLKTHCVEHGIWVFADPYFPV